jgi:hypothetical protein
MEGVKPVKSSPQQEDGRRAVAVEEELALALLLWDAGEQPRRRMAGIRGAAKP